MWEVFRFKPAFYQLDFAYDCLNHDRVVGVFCRQSGKSETVSKIAIILAMQQKQGDVLIFAPTDRQAGLLADKIKRAVRNMMKLPHFYLVNMNMREFSFSNGRKIICDAVGDKGATIRGYTAGDLILEEASLIKDSIIQEVILPMGATTNPTIIKIGTPSGKNHFFESSKDPRYKVHTYSYKVGLEGGILKESYINDMIQVYGSVTNPRFRTEMMAEFIEDDDSYFPYSLIDSCVDNSLTWGNKMKQEGQGYFLGADIARTGQDSTCLITVSLNDEKKAEVFEIVEIQGKDLTVPMNRIKELHDKYNYRRMFLDQTGLGAGVVDVLAKNYNLYHMQEGARISGYPKQYSFSDKVIGVTFTLQSKIDMFSNLKALMYQGRLKFPNHPKLVAQLRDFRQELMESGRVKLHHSDYGFDDFVDALALSVKECSVNKPVLII
jgi:hypothetical protein